MAYINRLAFLEGGNASSNLFNQLMDGGLSDTASIKFVDRLDASNSKERTKNKISKLVESQFPEFIAYDYPKFVRFLEIYYEFLQKDYNSIEILQNARDYSDIDRTAAPFVEYFLRTYADNIPSTFKLNKKLLIKRINDLYESKGSELSFKLLFRIFFDKEVELAYPYENILRVSDGIWEQRYSIHVQTISGSISDIENRFLASTINSIEYAVQIQSIRAQTASITEIFVDSRNVPPFSIGDTVVVSDEDGIIFSGIIVPTSVSYRVDQAGTGFKVGQYFNIKKAGAVATTILITGITPSGGIKSFSFINYGYGFSTSFSTYLRSNKNTSESQEAFNSETNGFIESIQIYEPHDISSPARYFDSDYVTYSTPTAYYTGEQLLDQTTSSTTVSGTFTTAIDPNVAIITFFLGPLGKYPGSYASNKGFISDSQIRLEDDKLYQPFAYQTSVELEYNAFYDIVKKLVHPAGTRLFNNRLITANIDLRSSFSVETAENLFFEAHDFYSVFDNNFIETNKVISETLNLLDEESLSFTKVEADNIQTLDSDFYQLDKIVSEIITLSDFLEVDWKNKNLYNNVTVTDAVTTISISKTLSDSLILTDSGDIIFTDYAINYFSEFYGGSSSNLT